MLSRRGTHRAPAPESALNSRSATSVAAERCYRNATDHYAAEFLFVLWCKRLRKNQASRMTGWRTYYLLLLQSQVSAGEDTEMTDHTLGGYRHNV
ncbi:hypothetical protein CPSG_10224 [Coccidioides posadasii str. Silveira]|uniref:Uncharacterized protein n=1 Tax=Coccidioides posadasii (strain RMSCC 757 / Silveira) TaxID=443226 RepID=E9DK75_COCPS|nr:hypothetical protein CPSG_10224 [Coccidioides posadasii str. Silveira]